MISSTQVRHKKLEKQDEKSEHVVEEDDMMGRLKDLGVFDEDDPENLLDKVKSSQGENRNAVAASQVEKIEEKGGRTDAAVASPMIIREKSEEEELKELVEQEEKKEIARDIIYDEVLPKVHQRVNEKQRQENLKKELVEDKTPIRVMPIQVEAKPYEPVAGEPHSGMIQVVTPIVIDPRQIKVVESKTDTEVKNVQVIGSLQPTASDTISLLREAEGKEVSQIIVEEKEMAVEATTTSYPELTEAAYPELKEKITSVTAAAAISTAASTTAVIEQKIEEDEKTQLRIQAIGAGTMMMGSSVASQLVEQKDGKEVEDAPLRVKSSLLVADLEPLTSVMDWVIKDEKLRLRSDIVALRIMKQHDEVSAKELNEFRIRSHVDSKSPFFLLVKRFFEEEQKLASGPVLLKARKERFDQQLKLMWPRELKTISKSLVGPNNGVVVRYDFNYERTWVSESDARALVKTLRAESELLLPELTKHKFNNRTSFLAVELHLFETRHSSAAVSASNYYYHPDAATGSSSRAMEHILQCADVLFYFLKKTYKEGNGVVQNDGKAQQLHPPPPAAAAAADSYKVACESFRKAVNNWIKVISSWIYHEGTSKDQEYIFRHLIQTKGLHQYKHIPQFPIDINKWGADVNQHFLKIMSL